jgi:ribose/xylose/arabinose/galactoside ABC-type transport system permease subunit
VSSAELTRPTPTAPPSPVRRALTSITSIDRRFLPVIGTVVTLAVMLVVGQVRYSSGGSSFVDMVLVSNLLRDNAYLLVLAVGLTFVILTGGIDLSVGAVVALVGLVVARLLVVGLPLPLVLVVGVLVGTVCGVLIGTLVQFFEIQPFIASLTVMFLARGLATVIAANESVAITQEGFSSIAAWSLAFGGEGNIWRINVNVLVAFAVVLVAFVVLHGTRFGRTVYGLGAGDGGTAVKLMGLRGERARFWVYVISGTCAGIAGIQFALYLKSGYALTGIGFELNAIAAVVIGGTLLSGGVGFVLGSSVGVLIFGLIQVLIAREGLGDSWWARIFIGCVVLVFVILQRVLMSGRIGGRRRPRARVRSPLVDQVTAG